MPTPSGLFTKSYVFDKKKLGIINWIYHIGPTDDPNHLLSMVKYSNELTDWSDRPGNKYDPSNCLITQIHMGRTLFRLISGFYSATKTLSGENPWKVHKGSNRDVHSF